MSNTANDNAVTISDIGDGVTSVTRGKREVRIAANGATSWGAAATASGCALSTFAGKTYKSHAGAVKAASKWLAA